MKENLHNIDKLFKASIDDHEELPSSNVWDALDKQLDKRKVVHIERKYFALRKVAVVLFVLLIGMGMYALQVWVKSSPTASTPYDKNNGKNIARNKKSEIPATQTSHTPLNNLADSATAFSNKQTKASDHDAASGKTKIQPQKKLSLNETAIGSGNFSIHKMATAHRQKSIALQPVKQEEKPTNAFINLDNGQNNFKEPAKTTATKTDQDKNSLITSAAPLFNLHAKEPLQTIPANTNNNNYLKQFRAEHTNFAINNNTIASNKYNRKAFWSATAFFSPNFTWNHLERDLHENREDDKDEIKEREQSETSFTTGVLWEFNKGSRWSFVSGLTFTRSVTSIKPQTVFARYDDRGNVRYKYNCSAGYSYLPSKPGQPIPAFGDSIKTNPSENTLHYLGVPLAARYTLGKGKLNFHTTAGASVNILIKQKIETEIKNGTHTETEVINDINGLKSVYFSGLIAAGIDYNLTKTIAFSFSPTVRFALTSINQNAPVKAYPKTLGLAAGLRFSL